MAALPAIALSIVAAAVLAVAVTMAPRARRGDLKPLNAVTLLAAAVGVGGIAAGVLLALTAAHDLGPLAVVMGGSVIVMGTTVVFVALAIRRRRTGP